MLITDFKSYIPLKQSKIRAIATKNEAVNKITFKNSASI